MSELWYLNVYYTILSCFRGIADDGRNARAAKRDLHDVPKHAEEVADRSSEDEQVPHHVRVGKRLPEVEQAAERVEPAAERQPHRAEALQRPDERHDGDDRDPAHDDVGDRRHEPELPSRPYLEEDARERPSPLDAEDRPRERGVAGAEGDEAERRVGAGDEEVYRHVVHDVEDALRGEMRHRMVRRRYRVEENHREPEDRLTGKKNHRRPSTRGQHR